MTTVDEFLEHHGVKGMKWGVRNDRGHVGQRATNKKIAKLDNKFARRTQSLSVIMAVYNDGAHKMNNGRLDAINNKPHYKNADLSKDTPLSRRYNKEVHNAFIKALDESAAARGTNASGTKQYSIVDTKDGGWDLTVKDVQHADVSPTIHVNVTRDANGLVTSIEVVAPAGAMAQADELVENILNHHGIKGMHWGVRRATPSASVPASQDHMNVQAIKGKAKAGGRKALSNADLQAYVTRVNLERQFAALQPGSQAKKFVVDLLVGVGKQQLTRVANDAAGQQVSGILKKKSAA